MHGAGVKRPPSEEVYESLCRDFYDSDSDTSGQSSTWSATSSGSSSRRALALRVAQCGTPQLKPCTQYSEFGTLHFQERPLQPFAQNND